jgi:hypothetical protein
MADLETRPGAAAVGAGVGAAAGVAYTAANSEAVQQGMSSLGEALSASEMVWTDTSRSQVDASKTN